MLSVSFLNQDHTGRGRTAGGLAASVAPIAHNRNDFQGPSFAHSFQLRCSCEFLANKFATVLLSWSIVLNYDIFEVTLLLRIFVRTHILSTEVILLSFLRRQAPSHCTPLKVDPSVNEALLLHLRRVQPVSMNRISAVKGQYSGVDPSQVPEIHREDAKETILSHLKH